jgi:putative transposase
VHYIQPGKPDQNACIERFNRSYRGEILNAHLVDTVGELQALSSSWLHVYNRERPHDSLRQLVVAKFDTIVRVGFP